MKCDRCPHMAKIKAALAPCQKCEAGKAHHQCSLDAYAAKRQETTGKAEIAIPATPATPTARADTYATTLPHDAEDALRVALASIFALDPLDLLLLRHVMAGNTLASFRYTLKDIRDRLAKYGLTDRKAANFRQLAKSWADRFVRLHPTYAPIFAAAVDANAGRGGGENAAERLGCAMPSSSTAATGEGRDAPNAPKAQSHETHENGPTIAPRNGRVNTRENETERTDGRCGRAGYGIGGVGTTKPTEGPCAHRARPDTSIY